MIGEPSERIAAAITEAYESAEDQGLRSYMMQAYVRLGPKAEAAIPTLEKATADDFEYVRAFAVEALARIDTDDAIRAMVPFLRTMRWFPYEPRKR
jgi:HEAT repeat protein